MANWSNGVVKFYDGDFEKAYKKVNKMIKNNYINPILFLEKEENKDELKETIEFLKEKFDIDDKKDFQEIACQTGGFNPCEVVFMDIYGKAFFVEFFGRWSGPSLFFEKMARDFNLSGFYEDCEPGCDFYFYQGFKEGKVTEEIETPYFSEERIKKQGIKILIEEFEESMVYNIFHSNRKKEMLELYKKELELFEKYGYKLTKDGFVKI